MRCLIRLELCRPFLKVGVEYLASMHVKEGGKRSKRKIEIWVALLVCKISRAVHFEIITDLTSESFTDALRRLVARSRKITNTYCDNATAFIGAKSQL